MNEKDFNSGFWYAVQQIAVHRDDIETAVWLIQESGFPREEMEESQKESGYEDERMKDVLDKAYSEGK